MNHLMLPGPTPLPPEVQQALLKPMCNHRSEAWREVVYDVEAHLQWFHETQNRVLVFAGSGTTGMEASLTNLCSPGDRVLAVSFGSFGNRFAQMAKIYGLACDTLSYPWGELPRLEDLEQHLKSHAPYHAVLLIHNETSTGVLLPLEAWAKMAKSYGALVIVDAISSLGTTPLPMDDWGVDIVLSASQKSYSCPPGLSLVAVSEDAWKAHAKATLPRYTLDFQLTREYADKGWNPWTPPIGLYYALQAALHLHKQRGLKDLQHHHETLMTTVRAGLNKQGLKLLVTDDAYASRAVTPVYPPTGVDADQLRSHLLERYNITLGGGQRQLTGQIFRVGHLGYQDIAGVQGVLHCIGKGIEHFQSSCSSGSETPALSAS